METFSKRLKELREASDMTQNEVAQLLHIKQQSYLRYEQNSGEPCLEILVQLAKIFDVSVDNLLGIEE